MPPRQLDQRLHELYSAHRPLARRVPRPPLGAVDPSGVRALTASDVHVLGARAAEGDDAASWTRVAAEIDAAAQLTPDAADVAYWRARTLLHRGSRPEAQATLDHALQLHPADGRLLRLLAEATSAELFAQPAAARDYAALDALVARVAQVDHSASAQAEVARYRLAKHDAEAARAVAEAAVAHNGECVECLDTLARVRATLHDDAGAAEAEARAVARLALRERAHAAHRAAGRPSHERARRPSKRPFTCWPARDRARVAVRAIALAGDSCSLLEQPSARAIPCPARCSTVVRRLQ